MTHEETRKTRINKVFNSVKKCGKKGANKEKLIAILGVEDGVSRRTALDYINNLILAEFITEKEGLLFSN